MSAANFNGRFLEDFLERELSGVGFFFKQYDEHAENLDLYVDKVVLKNVPYKNIYGLMGRSEFVIRLDSSHRRIRVECKSQNTSGSVDEKLPYLFFNARDYMPEDEIILLLQGGGFRPAAVTWLKRECASCTKKKITVMSMEEFHQFAMKLRHAGTDKFAEVTTA